MSQRLIAALGGGGFSMEPRNPRMDRWLLSLTRRRNPRVLFIPTASGDSPRYIAKFHRAFARHACRPAHLELFQRTVRDLRDFILRHHLIYVGGGNTANMMAIWRTHGVDAILREAWEQGSVLCGVSAGAICWFDSGVTDSFSITHLQPFHGALGLIPGSFCPHYDGERHRRPAFRRFTGTGELPPGYAAEDSVAVLFDGTAFGGAFASRRGKRAYRVVAGREEVIVPDVLAR